VNRAAAAVVAGQVNGEPETPRHGQRARFLGKTAWAWAALDEQAGVLVIETPGGTARLPAGDGPGGFSEGELRWLLDAVNGRVRPPGPAAYYTGDHWALIPVPPAGTGLAVTGDSVPETVLTAICHAVNGDPVPPPPGPQAVRLIPLPGSPPEPEPDRGPFTAAAHQVADAAEVAGPPAVPEPLWARPDAGVFPSGIQSLPVTACAGAGLRPGRYLYADGTPVTCVRPAAAGGGSWQGTAEGITRAPGGTAGWLQVVRGPDGRTAVHPALVFPSGTRPHQGISPQDAERLRRFDDAEAAGMDRAALPARMVQAGDKVPAALPLGPGEPGAWPRAVIRAEPGPGGRVTVTVTWWDRAGIPSPYAPADEMTRAYAAGELVEVMQPARHPAQDGPAAALLFGPAPRLQLPATRPLESGQGMLAHRAGTAGPEGPAVLPGARVTFGAEIGRAVPPAPGPAARLRSRHVPGTGPGARNIR
jgi:hypothetical protein